MISAYWHEPQFGLRSRIEGPMAIAQVDDALFGGYKRVPETDKMRVVGERLQNMYFREAWEKIKGEYRAGDELYFFTTEDMTSGSRFGVRQGYIAIRGDEIIGCLVIKGASRGQPLF